MIELKSVEGPDVLGPNRYKVANPVPDPYVPGDYGLSSSPVMLDGELVFVHHVSHKRLDTYPKELVIVVKQETVKRLQCKDIPDLPILGFLKNQEDPARPGDYKWATHGKGYSMPTVNDAMPMVNESNWKLAPAKMSQLIRRGLVSGSTCLYSRGDYVITDKGLDYLQEQKNTQALYEIHPTDFI